MVFYEVTIHNEYDIDERHVACSKKEMVEYLDSISLDNDVTVNLEKLVIEPTKENIASILNEDGGYVSDSVKIFSGHYEDLLKTWAK